MDQKTVKKFVFYISLITVVFPILINILMFISVFPVAGDEKTWISTLGTFWGAIFGGVISGVLTLIGVNLTIRSSFKGLEMSLEKQDKERFIETIGTKLNHLYKIKGIVFRADRMLRHRSYGWNENLEKTDLDTIESEILVAILPTLNPLLADASTVDWEFYNDVKKLVSSVRSCVYAPDMDFDKLAIVYDRFTKKIEDHEERLSSKFQEVSS